MAKTSRQKDGETSPKSKKAAEEQGTRSAPIGSEDEAAGEPADAVNKTKSRHEGKNGGSGANPEDEASDVSANPDSGESAAQDGISAQDELAAERDRYLRLAAEYDNFRKRSIKEMKTVYSDARADAITKLLPVYDNLERALKMECSDEPFLKGVEMTMTQLTEILEGMGVVYIKAVGESFDPNRHNAVAAVEDPGLGKKIVAEEYQKGFMLGDRVIRFSTVVVAN